VNIDKKASPEELEQQKLRAANAFESMKGEMAQREMKVNPEVEKFVKEITK